MIALSLDKKNALGILAGVVGVLVLIGLLLSSIAPLHRPRASENLPQVNGALDNTKRTYDTVKSALYVRASKILMEGDARGAETLYREIIAKYPGDADGHESLGASLYFQGRYEEAKAEYQRALDMNPRSVAALYGLGCVEYEHEHTAEAKDYLDKALSLDPNNAMCHRVLGSVYDQVGDKPHALQHYERAIALDPSVAGDADIKQRVAELKKKRLLPNL